jgi:hypothetical protein
MIALEGPSGSWSIMTDDEICKENRRETQGWDSKGLPGMDLQDIWDV